MAKLGKRTKAVREAVAGKSDLTVEEAVSLVKTNATAKFDETIEIAMNLGSTRVMRTKWCAEWLDSPMVRGNRARCGFRSGRKGG